MKFKHSDCLNFCNIDAAKGICRLTHEFINIDSDTCDNLKMAPKCHNCQHFCRPDSKGVGQCTGLAKEDWTFADLNAITCEGHEFKQAR